MENNRPYILLTPGPLTTTESVKNVMLKDWCTWDKDYNQIVQEIRATLLNLARVENSDYTAVLMQGSGTFAVESVIGTAIPTNGNLLVLVNGAYGQRIAQIAQILKIETCVLEIPETDSFTAEQLEESLKENPGITHVAMVHCETTTGILNPIEQLASVVKNAGKTLIVDAMSSFGGIPIDMKALEIDFLISSANKCIQGVPGFGFIIAKREAIEACKGEARSLSLDLWDQWNTMENQNGKWRFTSPTHVVRAFHQALKELQDEGGIEARYQRYKENQKLLVEGMQKIGYKPLLQSELQSPIITAFCYPSQEFLFTEFYEEIKSGGFVLYPGKVSQVDTFRIGNIGEVYPEDIDCLLEKIKAFKLAFE